MVTQELVFEIDSPEENCSEEEFSSHYVYELILTYDPEAWAGRERSPQIDRRLTGQLKEARELEGLFVIVREFESKEVLDILQTGDEFDSVRLVAISCETGQEIPLESEEEYKGGLQLCLVNAHEESVWVWAREEISNMRKGTLREIPI